MDPRPIPNEAPLLVDLIYLHFKGYGHGDDLVARMMDPRCGPSNWDHQTLKFLNDTGMLLVTHLRQVDDYFRYPYRTTEVVALKAKGTEVFLDKVGNYLRGKATLEPFIWNFLVANGFVKYYEPSQRRPNREPRVEHVPVVRDPPHVNPVDPEAADALDQDAPESPRYSPILWRNRSASPEREGRDGARRARAASPDAPAAPAAEVPGPAPPATAAREPVAGPALPAVEAREPVAGAAPPAVAAREPVAGAAPPAIVAREPVAGAAPPAIVAREPVAGAAPPAVAAREPVAVPALPAVAAQEPVARPAPPAVAAREPVARPAPPPAQAGALPDVEVIEEVIAPRRNNNPRRAPPPAAAAAAATVRNAPYRIPERRMSPNGYRELDEEMFNRRLAFLRNMSRRE